MENKNFLYDSLYYLHLNSGASDEKVRGVILGMVSSCMAFGWKFETCMSFIKNYINTHEEKNEFRDILTMLPECWREPYLGS